MMKKNLKRIPVLLTVTAMLMCLCGCSALDEMRKNQAFPGENGDILWNGAVYKALPDSEYLYIERNYESDVYLTAPDVPVLLSTTIVQSYLEASEDGAFLISWSEEDRYCREDLYEDILSRIQSEFVPDMVCYSYEVYDEETDELKTEYYTLTQEQVEVIELVVENTEPTVMSDGMYLDCEWSLYLEECSEDMLFRRNSADISVSGTTYYLHLYTNEGELLFTVPEGCNDAFAGIVKAYRETFDYWDTEIEDLI